MSFIQVIDVIMNSGQRSRLGGPNSITGNRQYDNNTYRFPIDIGNYDKGHYILFHVNAQTSTQFKTKTSSDDPVIIQNMKDLKGRRGDTNFGQSLGTIADSPVGQYVSGVADKIGAAGTQFIDKLNENGGNIFGDVGNFISGGVSNIRTSLGQIDDKFVRKIQRTTDTIALYMPNSMQFDYHQGFSNPALGNSLIMQGAAAGSVYEQSGRPEDVGRNLSPFIMNFAANVVGSPGQAIFTAATGMVQNPMMEVIYSSPEMRKFNFTFAFYPRSEAEAAEVQNILERFRFHQAPEIKKNSGGLFLIPPSEFDIKFMYNGKENPNIDKISTCVLTGIQVDYAKTGTFSAYEVEGENQPKLGRTGMPVGIGLSLSFMETQIITKEYYRQDSGARR